MSASDKQSGSTMSTGAPAPSDRNALTIGADGPILLHDVHFLEQMAHFNREKVPERQPHAKGAGVGALIGAAAVIAVYVFVKSVERFLLIRLLRTTRIDVTELRTLMQGDAKPIVLDVRSRIARQLDPRRLPGAIAVDMHAPQVALIEVPPDRDVVVYCS